MLAASKLNKPPMRCIGFKTSINLISFAAISVMKKVDVVIPEAGDILSLHGDEGEPQGDCAVKDNSFRFPTAYT